MGWAAAAPIIASAVGGMASGAGGKKAAKKGPQIPGMFKPALGSALGLLQNRLTMGAPAFLGPILAGQDGVLGPAGSAGVRDSYNTMHQFAQSGLSPEILKTIQDTTDPFYAALRNDLVGGSREATASRFFGTGSAQQEMDTLRRFEGDRAASSIPLALQAGQQQMSAAGALMSLLSGEWQRMQPDSFIPMLAQLMGQAPAFQPAVAPNFGMIAGANISSLAQSPGFMNWLMQATGGQSAAAPASSNPWMVPSGTFNPSQTSTVLN